MTKFTFSVWMTCLSAIASGQVLPILKFDQGIILITGLGVKRSEATSVLLTENQWREILSIYTQEAYDRKISQPIAGTYTLTGDSILFTASFPFAPGENYHAVFSGKSFFKNTDIKEDRSLELSFSIPKEKFPLTFIESVYPQSAVLPENILRMYICFSEPMMPGEAYDHIKLFNSSGTEVEKAFLIVDQELWDVERKRFTILFDPGRIKRGIKSNLDLGTPLREGEKYHLAIDSMWRDVNGNFLGQRFKKFFSVTQAERTKLSIRNWKVIAPLAGSRHDVVISFDRPMDYALTTKYFVIHDALSNVVSGDIKLVNDTTWKFTPDHAWENGNYLITISPLMEDVAGNNFNNVFDIDLTKDKRINSDEPIRLSFSIKPTNK